MINPDTGDAPNLGANDGSNLLPLTNADYRDYRPSVALAARVFADESVYSDVKLVQDHLAWLELKSSEDTSSKPLCGDSRKDPVFNAAGYILLNKGPWTLLFRYPFYRFRPGHCDALHVDLWHRSFNLLPDAGSFSYNSDVETIDYFTGCAGHNTIQFDSREPMPKVSRFLRGEWLEPKGVKLYESDLADSLSASAGYRDWQGATHHREIKLSESELRVTDHISGFKKHAVLRWRLAPGDWQVQGRSITNQSFNLHIESTAPIEKIQLLKGWESRYYLDLQALPVLEVFVATPGCLTTVVRQVH
ncbi:Heparinase II/III-like [Burkholderiales bacterium]